MKRALIPCLILVFVMAPLLSIQPTAADPANLSITSSTQTLFAGTNNQVNFTIRNLGDDTANQIFITLSLPSSASGGALMILNGSDGKYYIDSLGFSEKRNISANIYVSPSAAGGTYQLIFTMSYQSVSPKTDTRTIGVNVPTLNVTGASLSASISPYELVIGQNNILTLKLQNIGDADAMSVTVSLAMPGAATGSSPLSLINSDGRWTYDTIKQNNAVLIPLTVYASPSASGQTYQAALTLTYSDYIRARSDSKYLTLSVPFSTSPAVNFEMGIAPQDLKAGEVNALNITIANKGDSDATYVQAVLTMPPSGASGVPMVLQQSDGRWFFNTLKAGSTVNISAKVYVSPSSSGTAYQASLTLSYFDSLNRAKQDIRYFGLNVPSVYSPAAVIDIALSKSDLRAGESNYLNITVKNVGDGPADSLSLYLTMPAAATGTPLVLIGSDGSWSLGRLAPGEERIIPLEIFAALSASGSIMSLTASTSYTDMNYKLKQQTNYLGVIVKGITDLVVLDTSTFPVNVTPGKAFSLTVTVINLGTATAQSVIILPNGTADLQPVSTDKVFIGDLPIDVPSSFTLSYIAGNISSGTYMLNLAFNYTDSLSQKLIGHLDVPLRLTIATNASTTNGQSEQQSLFAVLMFYLPIIAIIAVVIVAVYLYMRRRKSG